MEVTSIFVMPILRRTVLKRGEVAETYRLADTKDHRDRAIQNHGQTLERLRERGGLGWTELYCVVCNKRPSDVRHNAEAKDAAMAYLRGVEP